MLYADGGDDMVEGGRPAGTAAAAEYTALRQMVDDPTTHPDTPLPQSLLDTPRDILGLSFEPEAEPWIEASLRNPANVGALRLHVGQWVERFPVAFTVEVDGEEVASYTDPNDSADHPYTGGWPIGECRNDMPDGGSLSAGDVAPNFTLTDWHGDDVSLHDFCHMAVMVVTGAEWCGPCQAYRADMASFYDSYFERGLMIIDLLGETASGGEPTETDLENWADGHSYAVVADPGWSVSNQGYVSGGIPAMSLIGVGGVVVYADGGGPTSAQIEEALPTDFVMPETAYEDGAIH